MDMNSIDRKGLIREAYRIDGITYGECRSIFLDWALNLPDGQDSNTAITHLLDAYGTAPESHPMTAVLREGLADKPDAKRRGGRKARLEAKPSKP
ncbi:hypothetical protein BCF46_2715 [Litoreibacter meonggei]|uniref:Uncharacterized protein n=1 Tax=Litoreibacter meonggei TaxID=1049199 RepID=A0A497VHN0_9RHOB|nr:hypothetical protein [Litoreibacter meonggei]RLJ41747.1 hypothetical protein BCF46_2715 [Litoreibacter meonggei]